MRSCAPLPAAPLSLSIPAHPLMNSHSYRSLLDGYLAEAAAARTAGDRAAALIWELAAARLTQAEAESLQEQPAADPAPAVPDHPAAGEQADDFARRVQSMDMHELRSRVITQRDYLRDHGTALQGLGIPADIMRPRDVLFPSEIRHVVSALLDRLAAVRA